MMAANLIAKFTKPGAVFSSAEAAQADRKSLFTDDLKSRIAQTYQALGESGIIIAGPFMTWDQGTFTLTIERTVTDHKAYRNFYANIGGTVREEIYKASTDAGWNQTEFTVVPVQ